MVEETQPGEVSTILKRCQPVTFQGRGARVSGINYGPSPLRCQAQACNFLLTISQWVHLPTQMRRGRYAVGLPNLEAAALRQGLMTSGNLNIMPAMGRTTSTCRGVGVGSRSK
jgi:hypothetical protein